MCHNRGYGQQGEDFTQGGVTDMMKKFPGYIGLCLLIMAILSGCTETQPSEQPVVKETDTSNTITVAVDFCMMQRSQSRGILVKDSRLRRRY